MAKTISQLGLWIILVFALSNGICILAVPSESTTQGVISPPPDFHWHGSSPPPGTQYIRVEAPMNNETVSPGDHVTLHCRIRGYPRPRYLWFRNGGFIKDGTGRASLKYYDWGSSLTIRNVDTLDMGPYKCTAHNDAGEKHVVGRIYITAETPSAISSSVSDSGSVEDSCERYRGTVCKTFIGESNVYISSDQDQDTIEESVDAAVMRISTLNGITEECKKYIIPSICLVSFPLCTERAFQLTTHTLCAGDCNVFETGTCSALFDHADSTGDADLGRVLPVCSDLPSAGTEGRNTCISLLGSAPPEGPINAPTGEYIALERPMNNQTIYSGDKVLLRCRITGHPKPLITWFKNDGLLTDERMGKHISIKEYDWGSKLSIRNVDTTDTGYYRCIGENSSGRKSTQGIIFATWNPNSDKQPTYEPSEAYCHDYQGTACKNFINSTIFVTKLLNQNELEKQLQSAFVAIVGNLSDYCQEYAIPSLCFFAFPQCIQTASYPISKKLCREECEIMEQDICKFEYERAQLHPKVILPDCSSLPIAGSKDWENCMRVDIPTATRITNDMCYDGNGINYRGKINTTKSGYVCQPWYLKMPHQHNLWPSQYHELAGGHNYCRNPGGGLSKPWCLTMNKDKRVEECQINECVYTEAPPVAVAAVIPAIAVVAIVLIIAFACIIVCYRMTQQRTYANSTAHPMRQTEITALHQNNKVHLNNFHHHPQPQGVVYAKTEAPIII